MYVPKTRRNGTSSSLVHPVWPTTNDEWWTFIPSDEEKGTRVRDIESRFGPEPRPRRHIWAVFFKTGCLIWYRRQPPCECGLVLRDGRMWLVLHPFGTRAYVAILHKFVVRQENITLHGQAIRFFCSSRVHDSDKSRVYVETTYFIPTVRYSYYK